MPLAGHSPCCAYVSPNPRADRHTELWGTRIAWRSDDSVLPSDRRATPLVLDDARCFDMICAPSDVALRSIY